MQRDWLLEIFIGIVYSVILYNLFTAFTKKFTEDKSLLKYSNKAFWIKASCSLAFMIIHSTLYGGDTNVYKMCISWLYSNFFHNPELIFNMLTAYNPDDPQQFAIARVLYFGLDSREGLVVIIGTFISFITFDTYLGIALFYSIFALSGMWAVFTIFVKYYPIAEKKLYYAFFCIPSLVFWSSGLLKDSLCIGAMGWLFWGIYKVVFTFKIHPLYIIIIVISALMLKSIKVYILLCFLPAVVFWVFIERTARIKNKIVKYVIGPIFFFAGSAGALYSVTQITKNDSQYSLNNLGQTTKSTAEWIKYVSDVERGSSYDLGELDGSFGGMMKLAPQAINVSLFRPYLWEARKPAVFISALESLFLLGFTLYIFRKVGFFETFKIIGSTPIVLFSVIFSVTFAFAVGISSYNFGTLVRYKIPLLPFYVSALIIMESFIIKKKMKGKRTFFNVDEVMEKVEKKEDEPKSFQSLEHTL